MGRALHRFTSILADLSPHGEAHPSRALHSLVSERLEAGPGEGDLQTLMFARALSRLLSAEPEDALIRSLRDDAVPGGSFFPLLEHTLPPVALAGPIAQALLERHLAGSDEVVLLDIGPGTGRQAVGLLKRMAERGERPGRLTLVAVEPDAVRLHAARRAVTDAAARYAVPFTFHGLQGPLEGLTGKQWRWLASLPGTLLVHAAFALHRVRGRVAGQEARDLVLKRLWALGPRALVLVEPNVDHHESVLAQRFLNCWHYFGLMFELVDQLPLPREDQDGLRTLFGREIEDILGRTEATRALRHERVEHWWARLVRAGFARPALPEAMDPGTHPLVRATAYPGYVGLDYAGETLVAVLCATAPCAYMG